MRDELQAQVRRRLASATLAHRISVDDLELLVKALEHAQALPDEGVGFDRVALAVEQERIAFDLGEHEFPGVCGEDRVQQLIDDVGAVYELGLAQKLRVAANVRDQNRCAFSHCPPSSKAFGRGLERFTRLTREKPSFLLRIQLDVCPDSAVLAGCYSNSSRSVSPLPDVLPLSRHQRQVD